MRAVWTAATSRLAGLPAVWIALGGAVLAALLAQRLTLEYSLIGFDTFLQIAAARIESWNDLLGTFTERLTDGRIDADFYRPVQNLSIAWDYALFGTTAWGYQLNSLVVLGLTVAAVFLTTRRLLGGAGWVGPLTAALVFGLHPALLHVVPVPCRRSEMLTVLFLCLMLLTLPQSGQQRVWPRLSLAATWALLACGSKDIGVMALGLAFLHQLFYRYDQPLRSVGRAALASLPVLLACLLYLFNRFLVLGGWGGYRNAPPFTWARHYEKTIEYGGEALADVLLPAAPIFWPELDRTSLAAWLGAFWLVVGSFIMIWALAARRAALFAPTAALALGLAWCLPSALLVGATVHYGPWYTTIPLAGVAFTFAAMVHFLLLPDSGRIRLAALAGAPVMLISAALIAQSTPLVRYYPELDYGSRIVAMAVQALDEHLPITDPGGTIHLDVPPIIPPVEPLDGRMMLRRVATVQPRGLQAYAEIRFPDKKVEAVYFMRWMAHYVPPDTILIRCLYYRTSQ